MRFSGIDLVRLFAISMVVLYHSEFLFEGLISFPFLSYIPFYGSDVFFVTSGFLIGSRLLYQLEQKAEFTGTDFKSFYLKRAIKILPAYYLMLGVNIILAYFQIMPGTISTKLLSFVPLMQNFFKPYDFIMWESWSLGVEHWFYFLFPLMIWALLSVKRNISPSTAFLTTASTFILIPLLLRFIANDDMQWEHVYWDLHIRKMVFMRLDAIGYGILSAFLFHRYSHNWKKYSYPSAFLGIMVFIFVGLISNVRDNQLSSSLELALIAIGIACFLPVMTSIGIKPLQKGLKMISERIYTVYLTHIPAAYIIYYALPVSESSFLVLRYLLYLCLVTILSLILFVAVEQPIIRNRSKIVSFFVRK